MVVLLASRTASMLRCSRYGCRPALAHSSFPFSGLGEHFHHLPLLAIPSVHRGRRPTVTLMASSAE